MLEVVSYGLGLLTESIASRSLPQSASSSATAFKNSPVRPASNEYI